MSWCSYNFIKFSMCIYNFNVAFRISTNPNEIFLISVFISEIYASLKLPLSIISINEAIEKVYSDNL